MKINRSNYLFTSESVSAGHSDKICDQISDAIVDLYLKEDSEARAAIEVMAIPNRIIIAGEIRGALSITNKLIEATVRQLIKEIGYEQPHFHWQNLRCEVLLHQQSTQIASGVDSRF